MSVTAEGWIRKEECPSHLYVEWNVDFGLKRCSGSDRREKTSPVFSIDSQRFLFKLSCTIKNIVVSLYRMGPSDKFTTSQRWWGGLKLNEKTYRYKNRTGKLCLEEGCESWKYVADLKKIPLSNIRSWDPEKEERKRIIAFLILQHKRNAPTWTKMCTHGVAEMSALSTGYVQEKDCLSHRYFEWDIDPMPPENPFNLISPVFTLEYQSYFLELSRTSCYELRLYRMGPSMDYAVLSWRAGVKLSCVDGLHPDSNNDGSLNLAEELSTWTEVQHLITVNKFNVEKQYLAPGKKVAFFFSLDKERPSIEKVACNPGGPYTLPLSIGSIAEQEWTSYKQVQWNIDYESTGSRGDDTDELSALRYLFPVKVYLKSSVFKINNQQYFFSLEIVTDAVYIRLFRKGPSINRSVQWWVRVRCGGRCNSESGSLDLARACDTWTYDGHLILLKKDEKAIFTVDFLMSLTQLPNGIDSCVEDTETQPDVKPPNREFIVFRVKDKRFKGHRALLSLRIPVFEAMLSHDTMENRTGVVCIKDCEPTVFEAFLNFIDTGKEPEMNVDFAVALCVVADKYLLVELALRCLSFIERALSTGDKGQQRSVLKNSIILRNVLQNFQPDDHDWPQIVNLISIYSGQIQ